MTPLERVARAILDAEREFRGSDPIGDDEWRNYWSPGGPTAMPSLIAMRAKAALLAISEALDESGMVEGARQAAEIDGSEAAAQASRTYYDVIAWLDEQAVE